MCEDTQISLWLKYLIITEFIIIFHLLLVLCHLSLSCSPLRTVWPSSWTSLSLRRKMLGIRLKLHQCVFDKEIHQDLWKGAERRRQGCSACILSRTYDFTSKNSNWASDPMLTEPWTLNQMSMLQPRLFISETTSTVQDSLNLQHILPVSNIPTS